jgi:hypothetical protein
MGVRTVHQAEAKAQLVARCTRQPGHPWAQAHAAGQLPGADEEAAALEAAVEQAELPPDLRGFTADSDVLRHPRLLEDEGEGAGAAGSAGDGGRTLARRLHSMEQALLLGWAVRVRKGGAADGLRPWEVAAYVDAGARQACCGCLPGCLPPCLASVVC